MSVEMSGLSYEKCFLTYIISFAVVLFCCSLAIAQTDGFLPQKDAGSLFPIGFYELPESDDDLSAMADSGVNFIRCRKKEDLDRAHKTGMKAWFVLDLKQGKTEKLKETIESVKNHPALAVWEGPDEIVWQFTGWSRLWRKDTNGIYKHKGEWWMQTPEAIEYSDKKAQEIIPKLIDGIDLIRALDKQNRQVWLNEARNSDLKYCRMYMDHIDVTGCDYYPIRGKIRDAIKVGKTTERWMQNGRGKPVWMVLQAFSWGESGDPGSFYYNPDAYPSFDESRLMAYVSIVYGAKGIIYWGSSQNKTPPLFRNSLYALTRELSILQPFLTAADEAQVKVRTIGYMTAGHIEGWFEENEEWPPPKRLGVRSTVRKSGDDWLVVLVNEDDCPHYGVEISGLNELDGRELSLLYGDEEGIVQNGEYITRMKPFEVKVFATSRDWETDRQEGRDYPGVFAE